MPNVDTTHLGKCKKGKVSNLLVLTNDPIESANTVQASSISLQC